MKPTFNPRKLTLGIIWRAKPRMLWIELPMLTVYVRPGKECPNCHGQGGWAIEAGDGQWFDECETCHGSGVANVQSEPRGGQTL